MCSWACVERSGAGAVSSAISNGFLAEEWGQGNDSFAPIPLPLTPGEMLRSSLGSQARSLASVFSASLRTAAGVVRAASAWVRKRRTSISFSRRYLKLFLIILFELLFFQNF